MDENKTDVQIMNETLTAILTNVKMLNDKERLDLHADARANLEVLLQVDAAFS